MTRYVLLLVCGGAPLLCWGGPTAANPYVITDLGAVGDTLGTSGQGGMWSAGAAVNSLGQMTGDCVTTHGDTLPFLYSGGTMYDLGTLGYQLLGGQDHPASTNWGKGINDSGQVAGTASLPMIVYPDGSVAIPQHACLWTPTVPNGTAGGMIDLAADNSTFGNSGADAINNSSVAVGWANSSAGQWTGFHAIVAKVAGGVAAAYDIGTANGAHSRAYAISDAGEIAVGVYTDSWHTYLYTGGTAPMQLGTNAVDLGAGVPRGIDSDGDIVYDVNSKSYVWVPSTPQGTTGRSYLVSSAGKGYGIWDAGGNAATATVVGVDSIATVNRATGAVLSDTTVSSVLGAAWLGKPYSSFTAYGVNGSGQVVGTAQYSYLSTDPRNPPGTMITVNEAFSLSPAVSGDANLDGKVDINDLSRVLANYDRTAGANWGTGDFNGDGKIDINDLSVILTNYDRSLGASNAGPAAVPEPAALVLLGIAAAGLGVFRSSRKRL